MIVKIQQSLATNHEDRQMLIYDKARDTIYQEGISKDVELLLAGRAKAYFEASIDSKGLLSIGDEVEEQNW